MNLHRLYPLLADRTNSDKTIRLPAWQDIADAAEVQPFDDTAALRALIEKGAIDRRFVPNTFSDCTYILREPDDGCADAFMAALRTVGANVRHLRRTAA